jgi:hypothetical protein
MDSAAGIWENQASVWPDIWSAALRRRGTSEFEFRLAEVGYTDRPEYERVQFSVDHIRFYPVGDRFPRITFRQIPTGISRLTYDLDLYQCGEYRSEYIHESR